MSNEVLITLPPGVSATLTDFGLWDAIKALALETGHRVVVQDCAGVELGWWDFHPEKREVEETAPCKTELEFQQALSVALCKLPEVRVMRTNAGSVPLAGGGRFRAGPPPGTADLVGIVGPEGWFLAVECKRDPAAARRMTETRKRQIRWAEVYKGLGAIHIDAFASDGVQAAVAHVRRLAEERRGT